MSSRTSSPSDRDIDGTAGSSANSAGWHASCRDRRRSACARARMATRRATPCSHGPSRPGSRIDPARRTSTRKVAWNASSTSCPSRKIRRQTPSTIGPCSATRAANAASSRSLANRSSNRPSSRPATGPESKSCPIDCITAICRTAMGSPPRPRRSAPPTMTYCPGNSSLFPFFGGPRLADRVRVRQHRSAKRGRLDSTVLGAVASLRRRPPARALRANGTQFGRGLHPRLLTAGRPARRSAPSRWPRRGPGRLVGERGPMGG